MCACANEHFLLDHQNTIPFWGWDIVESHFCLRLQHLCFIVNLTALQTRDLERNTLFQEIIHVLLTFTFFGVTFSLHPALSHQHQICVWDNWTKLCCQFYLQAPLSLFVVVICLLHFNSVCTMLIISVI